MQTNHYQTLLKQLDLRKVEALSKQAQELKAYVSEKAREMLAASLTPDKIQLIVEEIVGLGPIDVLFSDEQVTEVMVNAYDKIYVERRGRLQKSDLAFSSEESLRNILNKLISSTGRRIDEASPMVDARLYDGSRLNAVIHPLSLNGTCMTIRRFSKHMKTIAELIANKSISANCALFLQKCVERKKNILIAGGTGTGKTTILNLLSADIAGQERIITIEDAAELQLQQEHVIRLETRPANIEGQGQIQIRDLLKNALRMRPDRIIVGECRGPETIDMLQAMNTGHEGSMSTVHANSPRDALFRLENMILMSGVNLPLKAIRDQISSALDLIVFLKRLPSGKRAIQFVTEVCGTEGDLITLKDIFAYDNFKEELISTRQIPNFVQQEEWFDTGCTPEMFQ